jgi:hypothetical protein
MLSAVIPEILQSDNDSKFLGRCIYQIKEYFNVVYIVQGKPRKSKEHESMEL